MINLYLTPAQRHLLLLACAKESVDCTGLSVRPIRRLEALGFVTVEEVREVYQGRKCCNFTIKVTGVGRRWMEQNI